MTCQVRNATAWLHLHQANQQHFNMLCTSLAVAIPAYNPAAPAAAAFLLLLVSPSHHHMDTAEGLPPVVSTQMVLRHFPNDQRSKRFASAHACRSHEC